MRETTRHFNLSCHTIAHRTATTRMRSRFIEMVESGFLPDREVISSADCDSAANKSATRGPISGSMKSWSETSRQTSAYIGTSDPSWETESLAEADNRETGDLGGCLPSDFERADMPPARGKLCQKRMSGNRHTRQSRTQSTIESFIAPTNRLTARGFRTRRLLKAGIIAGILFETLVTEMEIYGRLRDYVGYPYRSPAKESAWDRVEEDGTVLCMAQHEDLFRDAIELLRHDLRQRGFIVRELCFREEKILFPTAPRGEPYPRGVSALHGT